MALMDEIEELKYFVLSQLCKRSYALVQSVI